MYQSQNWAVLTFFLFYHSAFYLRKQTGTNCFIQLLKKTEREKIVTVSMFLSAGATWRVFNYCGC